MNPLVPQTIFGLPSTVYETVRVLVDLDRPLAEECLSSRLRPTRTICEAMRGVSEVLEIELVLSYKLRCVKLCDTYFESMRPGLTSLVS